MMIEIIILIIEIKKKVINQLKNSKKKRILTIIRYQKIQIKERLILPTYL